MRITWLRGWIVLAAAGGASGELRFRSQEIARDFGVGYAVITADVNSDGRRDIVAINGTQVVWFENPTWRREVILEGGTKPDNVCIAAEDIDGDGLVDFALGADWQPRNTESGGTLQWVGRRAGAWRITPIGEEPTLHRIRWGDVDGDGRRELVVAPLHGRGGRGARILVYRPAGRMEVADDSLHIVHNILLANFDRDRQDEIVTASREGVHVIDRGPDGRWSRTLIGEGSPGEIRLGRAGRKRWLATVEPWHGSSIVMYEEAAPLWRRHVIETGMTGGHALGFGDFDGDGNDELAAGWRDKTPGLAVYAHDGRWQRALTVDGGGMATEDLLVEDLNGDGLPEIVAAGRATANVKIYWNETPRQWVRHVVAEGFRNHTVVGADFTGDGRPDVVAPRDGQVVLFAAPDWKPAVMHEGVGGIFASVATDMDGDGDTDWVGARYSPGLVFWLEAPTWRYHLIDDQVDGVHGLTLGDVDRDGKLDVIGNSAQPKGRFPNSIAWWRAPGFERHIFADRDAPGLSHYMGFGDVNGDGRPDIASAAKIAEGGNWFAWWEQPAAARRPWRKHLIAENQEGATNILMADVNGDGRTDFIASRGHGKGLAWYEAPRWTPHEVNAGLTGPHSLDAEDLDGDGDIDLATCAKDDFIAAWFENDGRGNFQTHVIHRDQAGYDLRLVDMDRDGDRDVLIAGQESQNVVWFENRLTPTRGPAPRRARRSGFPARAF